MFPDDCVGCVTYNSIGRPKEIIRGADKCISMELPFCPCSKCLLKSMCKYKLSCYDLALAVLKGKKHNDLKEQLVEHLDLKIQNLLIENKIINSELKILI